MLLFLFFICLFDNKNQYFFFMYTENGLLRGSAGILE